MAEEFASHGIVFAFLYTREAHPGENAAHHECFDDKITAARRMVERWDIRRPMLVDSLDGNVHRAYGSLPNMTWIINRAGTVIYKANWTDARSIRLAVEQLVYEKEVKQAKGRLAPFRVWWRPQRSNERPPFMQGLVENGPRAVDEFIEAVRHTGGDLAASRLEAWRDQD
jgi:hypothetical protein